MATVQDVFREGATDYLRKFESRMPSNHRKTIDSVLSCRGPDCGFASYVCADCGESHRIFRSCGNRHCPVCQWQKSMNWRDMQVEKSLPVPYFMVTFTIPQKIRRSIRSHQKAVYGAMFRASSEAMKALAADPKFFGDATMGFFGVLHTWGRTLEYNPHIHYVVCGGAWQKETNEWTPSKEKYFLPAKPLALLWRGKFRKELEKAGLSDLILHRDWRQAWKKDWIVNIQAMPKSEHAVGYLSSYVFRVAISDHRILSLKNGKVLFYYRRPGEKKKRLIEVTVDEFLRRFLQHTLPNGFMKIRYYGFMSAASGVDLDAVRMAAEGANRQVIRLFEDEVESTETTDELPEEKPEGPVCPSCGGRLVYQYSVLPYQMIPHKDSG